MTIEKEKTFDSLKDELFASISHQINWLQSIKEELIADTYTAEKARLDAEAAMWSEGFDWLSVLTEMGAEE